MQNTLETFDLLALAWWQNPWYWVAIFAGVSTIVLAAAFVYWYWRQALTPQEKIVRTLAQLRTLSCTTHEEQVRVYQYIFSAIKTHYHAVGLRAAQSLTDYELVDVMQSSTNDALSCSALLPLAQEVRSVATAIKFGHTTVAPQEVHKHIDQAHRAFVQICAQSKKN